MKMKSTILALLIAATAIGLALQHASYPKIVTTKTLYAANDFRGKKAPDFFIEKWLNAKEVDTRGKVVLIDFWATWCGPCRKSIPELNELAKKFQKNLVVIGISDESAETVNSFMKDTEMKYNVGIDTKKRMSKALGVSGIPHVMLISPDGIVRWQGFPGDDNDPLTEKVVQQVIDASGLK
jgi:cytochrome c biogenesis protein CcmG, thiol:disulfide interchange protein DsbE